MSQCWYCDDPSWHGSSGSRKIECDVGSPQIWWLDRLSSTSGEWDGSSLRLSVSLFWIKNTAAGSDLSSIVLCRHDDFISLERDISFVVSGEELLYWSWGINFFVSSETLASSVSRKVSAPSVSSEMSIHWYSNGTSGSSWRRHIAEMKGTWWDL